MPLSVWCVAGKVMCVRTSLSVRGVGERFVYLLHFECGVGMWLLILARVFCHTLCGVLSPLSASLSAVLGGCVCVCVCVWKWDCSESCATENERGSRWCLW